MKFMKRIILVLALLLIPVSANAAEKTDSDNNYGYSFDDDPINAGGLGASDAVIKVRPRAYRVRLLTPRTSFITELIKTVEEL